MRRMIFIIATILILISVTTYMYFRKQPVENIPTRATFVLNYNNLIEKEGDQDGWIKI